MMKKKLSNGWEGRGFFRETNKKCKGGKKKKKD